MTRIDLPDLRTEHLRLRPPREDDVPAIVACCQDPDIQRFTRVPSPYTTTDGQRWVTFCRDGLVRGTGAHLLAVDADDDTRVLGAIGLDVDRVDDSGEAGYWIAPDARRQGVASNGCRLLIRFGFEELGLAYIGLHAAATNPGSNAVARALGFTHEGTLRSAMRDGPSGDRSAPRCDANVWGLRPGELLDRGRHPA
ncbi:GNAT family N-acetyltransferase [Egicoccus halophilus]|uniref:N-acetyltransferase n=1 Tax=Egicoccus halophilus TaxID=1670830 RepID=A0A8J3A630_9ACTN|nr:GNAT family N-acetyltransferase [Egicoccus halophilus]GGI03815.1 N-acetyltransferase [Egicoccus halophilus]